MSRMLCLPHIATPNGHIPKAAQGEPNHYKGHKGFQAAPSCSFQPLCSLWFVRPQLFWDIPISADSP